MPEKYCSVKVPCDVRDRLRAVAASFGSGVTMAEVVDGLVWLRETGRAPELLVAIWQRRKAAVDRGLSLAEREHHG